MRYQRIVLIGLILLFSCKANKVANSVIESPKPSWVANRPLSSADYIGIGVAKKEPNINFIESAKSNALNDLASEIKVNLESNTIYSQSEIDGIIKENFRSTIKTSATADIEGYEIAGSWQNNSEYWVYYKLSKGEYLRRLEEKRLNAKKSSLGFVQNAKENLENGDIKMAIQHYFNAFSAIQDYPVSSIEVESNGKNIFLENLISLNVQQLFSAIQFKISDEDIRLDFSNRFSKQVSINVEYKGKAVSGIPFFYEYHNQYGPANETIQTNEKGILDVNVKAYSLEDEKIKNVLYINLDKLIGSRKDASLLKQKVSILTIPRLSIRADILVPKIYISNDELYFGEPSDKNRIKSIVVNELTKEGVLIVNTEEKADLTMEIKVNTKLQSKDYNFTAVGLNYVISILETKSKKTVLSMHEGPIKGVSLDEPRAADKAYEKAEGQLKRIGIIKIKSAILDF